MTIFGDSCSDRIFKSVAPRQEKAIDGTNRAGNEKARVRPEEIPCHHRRGQEVVTFSKKQTIFAQGIG